MPITVVTGPPGVGKTSVASSLARSKSLGVHLVGDMFFDWIVCGYRPPWQPDANSQNSTVIEATAAASARFSGSGYEVVVDGIVGPWFLETFLRAVGTEGETLSYVVLRPTREVVLQRALDSHDDGDLVDEEPVRMMYEAFENLGVLEPYVVDSSDQGEPGTVSAIQARHRDRDIAVDRSLSCNGRRASLFIASGIRTELTVAFDGLGHPMV